MRVRSKLWFTGVVAAGVVLFGIVLFAAIVLVLFPAGGKQPAFDKTAQLSNSAQLRFFGTRTEGPDSGDNWEVLYREGRSWEKAGNWWGGDWYGGNDGNIVACPVGRQVVVLKSNGSLVLVRSETGKWREFLMDIPLPHPGNAPFNPQTAWLETAELNSILQQMSAPPQGALLHPEVAGFRPGKRELWLDYVVSSSRLYRVSLRLPENDERFKLLAVEGRPNTLHLVNPDVPNPDIDATCTAIQFTHGLRE